MKKELQRAKEGPLRRYRVNYITIPVVCFILVSCFVQLGAPRPPINSSAAGPGPIALVGSAWVSGSAIPGQVNALLNVTIQNLNPYQISGVSEQLNLSGIPLRNSVNGTLASTYLSSAVPSGDARTTVFNLQVLDNVTIFFPQPMYAPLTVFYLNNVGALTSQTLSVQIFISLGRVTLSATPLSSSVQLGTTSTVSFLITNIGKVPAYSPSFSVSLKPELIVIANLTSLSGGSVLNPWNSIAVSWQVTPAVGVGLGTYSGTIVVSYVDQLGTSFSSTFAVAVHVVGQIKLVLRNFNIVPNPYNLTVTGSIINYGTDTALFTQVNGNLRAASGTTSSTSASLGSGAAYIGTVAPNLPAYFTLIVPFPSQNSPLAASLVLTLVYENSTGQTSTSTNSTSITLLPSSTGSQPPGLAQIQFIESALIAVIVAAPVLSFLYIRRTKRNEKIKSQIPS